MKTTKLICRSIVAACLCLGMAACGDDDGTNPGGGSNGEGGSVGSELKFTELNRQTYFDGVSIYNNSRKIGYNADGTLQYMGGVENDYYRRYDFEYADNAQNGSTITVKYSDNASHTIDYDCCTCEVNPEGHITLLTIYNPIAKDRTFEYTYDKDGRMTKAVETSYDLSGNIEGETTEHNISWKNGNITQIETKVDGEMTNVYNYKYTSYPASRGLVYYARYLLHIPFVDYGGVDEAMEIFANTGEFFGKSPKNLISSGEYSSSFGTTSWDIEYTFYEAPHPAEGFVHQIKKEREVLTITWQEPEEQI